MNVAIFVDGQVGGADKAVRNILAGLAGGFTGTAIMALGVSMLPSGSRDAAAWVPMLLVCTLADALQALDDALSLKSFLYPIWQAGVALALALRRLNGQLSRAIWPRSP